LFCGSCGVQAKDGGTKETKPEGWLLAEDEYETGLLLLCAIFDDVFQEENPSRQADRYTLEIYMNLIKVRIAKIRRSIDDREAEKRAARRAAKTSPVSETPKPANDTQPAQTKAVAQRAA